MDELQERGPTPPERQKGPDWNDGTFGEDGMEYLPIPLVGLQIDSIAHFDLFVRTAPNRFVKYRDEREVITGSVLQRLREFNHEMIYIPMAKRSEYARYIEQMLPRFIADPNIPVKQKASLVYTTSSNVIQDLISSPRGESFDRTQLIAGNLLDIVTVGGDLLGSLLGLACYDYYTYTHSVNTAVFAVALGMRLKLDSRDAARTLANAAILHDIGKTFLPPSILLKPASLTRDEFNVVFEHPAMGADIIRRERHEMSEVAYIVKLHHERIDGSGYPDGLTGSQIHPLAKIVAIADMYDAMTTRRVYRPAYSPMQAMRIMADLVGTHIDEEYFREFVKLLGTIGPT